MGMCFTDQGAQALDSETLLIAQALPATGEAPVWRVWVLVGLVALAVAGAVGGAYRRYRRQIG